MKRYISYFTALLVATVCTLAAMATSPPPPPEAAAQQFQVNCQVSFGLLDYTHTTLLNYVEPITSTATTANSLNISVPASTTNNAFTFSSSFPQATNGSVVVIQDVTYPPLATGLGLGLHVSAGHSARITLAPNGCMVFRINGQMPGIELDNGNTLNAVVNVGIISQ